MVEMIHKSLLSKWQEEKFFLKKTECKNGHCSSMSFAAWCDLNSKGEISKLLDLCDNPKCKLSEANHFHIKTV